MDFRERKLPREFLTFEDLTLYPGVFFVEGTKNGTLCDTNSGVVYLLNEVGCQVMRGELQSSAFWENLEAIRVATTNPETGKTLEQEKPNSLEFVWFEIVSDDCNERCVHCYADSMPPTHRKQFQDESVLIFPADQLSRERVQENRQRLTHDDWTKLLAEIHELGCRMCQFIGGEPFLYQGENKETVLDLAAFAKDIGYEMIEIFTNGTLLTADRIKRIKNLELHLAVSLYSVQEDIHDGITRTPGSFRKTMKSLELLREADVPTRVETVIMRANQGTIAETIAWIEQMGFQHKHPDVLRPKGRGDNPTIQPDKRVIVENSYMMKPDFYAQKEFFMRNMNGHSCLAGKMTITEFGDVLPCIFSRDMVLGNVLSQPLRDLVSSEPIQNVWNSTKDDVLVCQDCEYRYVCFDCRPISEAVNRGRGTYLTAPYPRCTYNPYTGEWAKGVWRLDEAGVPFYDMTLEQLIQEVAIANKDEKGVIREGH